MAVVPARAIVHVAAPAGRGKYFRKPTPWARAAHEENRSGIAPAAMSFLEEEAINPLANAAVRKASERELMRRSSVSGTAAQRARPGLRSTSRPMPRS